MDTTKILVTTVKAIFIGLWICFLHLASANSKYDLGPKISEDAIAKKETARLEEEKEKDFAKAACIRYVKTNLPDPSSAVFPIGEDERGRDSVGVKQKDGGWKITFKGKVRNAFNALVHSKFQCQVKREMLNEQKAMRVISAKQL